MKPPGRSTAAVLLLAAAMVSKPPVLPAGEEDKADDDFECLGAPVTKAMLMASAVGPGPGGEKEWVYFDFAQTGSTLFLVAADPDTGESRQYKAPAGPGAWALIRGPDDAMYLGTWESGTILKFDPREEEKGIQVLGKPSTTETYIWQFALGKDGKLYGGTYGSAKLISFDPRTGRMEDLGRMDALQMYTRSIACGPDGRIYTGIGYGRANVVVFDPESRQHRSILPEKYRSETVASVHQGADGNVYARCGGQAFRAEGESLVPIADGEVVGPRSLALRDGRTVAVDGTTGKTVTFSVADPRTGASKTHTIPYRGDGAMLFVVGAGPEGKVYGSSAMPLELFVHDPAAGESADLGNPTPVDGEIYSLLPWRGRLFLCAYPGSYLSVYDPRRPFRFGTGPTDNPRGLGSLGDGHLRPRAMILGPEEKLYIGSLPPYGQLGGALAVVDPADGKVLENYRHLVPDQSIVSLAFDEKSGLVFGGSSIAGGGGATPSAKEARFFAFDPVRKRKVFEAVLEPGASAYPAAAAAAGRLFVAAGSRLIEFDPQKMEAARTIDLPGLQVEISLGRHEKSGLLYGLTSREVYAVDPEAGKVVLSKKSPVPIRCGFAIAGEAIYFGSGAQLWRYRLAADGKQ